MSIGLAADWSEKMYSKYSKTGLRLGTIMRIASNIYMVEYDDVWKELARRGCKEGGCHICN